MHRTRKAWLWGLVSLLPTVVAAEEANSQRGVEKHIHRWIAQLDHPSYARRREAAQKLFEAGSGAIEPLVQAAQQGPLERTHQAVQILARMLTQGQGSLKSQARAALERLSRCENAPAARRARLALAQAGIHVDQRQVRPGIGVPQIVPGIRIQAGLIPAGKVHIRVQKDKNGRLRITRTKPGEEIQLTETPEGKITLQIKRKTQGKQENKRYEAKNAQELKQKHPEAYKLYRELKRLSQPPVKILVPGLQPGQ